VSNKERVVKFITNRIRVFMFGIAVAFIGLYDPSLALRSAHKVLDV
jgi:hypothetical protein